ncbi:hypothetical protein E0Z10_g6068 [Xylaria hypoxylon]|uniref:Transmembrane protein n=1 Tax=Xylaria hypoxylon TaxID=37992 RepID=A0A4Z0YTG8_9PEZI|nr:hypothetical protein E0Z10_g6068 [Xylaria hypoxylon]
MLNRSAVLVAIATVLSLYLHWNGNLLFSLGCATCLLAVAYNLDVSFLGAMVSFTASLVLLWALIASYTYPVIAIILQLLFSAGTNYGWWTFWLGITVFGFHHIGWEAILHTMSYLAGFEFLRATLPASDGTLHLCYSPFSILLSLSINFDFLTWWIHAYQMEIHPTVSLMLRSLLLVFIKITYTAGQVLYTAGQVWKTVVYHFTDSYHWCPDWKIEEIARISAEHKAKLLEDKPAPQVLRRQREETARRWPRNGLQLENGSSEGVGPILDSNTILAPGKMAPWLSRVSYADNSSFSHTPSPTTVSSDFLEVIQLSPKSPSDALNTSSMVEEQWVDFPTRVASVAPTVSVPVHQPLPPQVHVEAPVKPSVVAPPQSSRNLSTWVPRTPVPNIPDSEKKQMPTLTYEPRPSIARPIFLGGIAGRSVEFVFQPEVMNIDPVIEIDSLDVPMNDVVDDTMEELNGLLKGLAIKSGYEDSFMEMDYQSHALAWISGEAPFIPLYVQTCRASVSLPAPPVCPTAPLVLTSFSATLEVERPTVHAPKLAPPVISTAPMVPAKPMVMPAVVKTPVLSVPAKSAAPMVPSVTSTAPVLSVPTTSTAPMVPTKPMVTSTVAKTPMHSVPAKSAVPEAAPPVASTIPKVSSTPSIVPTSPVAAGRKTRVPRARSAALLARFKAPTAPPATSFNLPGPAPPAPFAVTTLPTTADFGFSAAFNAAPAVPTFQTAPTVSSTFHIPGLTLPMLSFAGPAAPTAPERTPSPEYDENELVREFLDESESGTLPFGVLEPAESHSFNENYTEELDKELFGEDPHSEDPLPETAASPTATGELSELTEMADDELDMCLDEAHGTPEADLGVLSDAPADELPAIEDHPSVPASFTPGANRAAENTLTQPRPRFTAEQRDQLEIDLMYGTEDPMAQLTRGRQLTPADMGIGHVPGPPPNYADAPDDVARANANKNDPNPRGGKRRN